MEEMLNVVTFGGGSGQSTLLLALRQNPAFRLTAVVSTFDAGSSSGVLRDRDGVLPPSDILRCAAALARHPNRVREMFTRVIERGSPPYHKVGNVFLAKLEAEYGRPAAVQELLHSFEACGTVLPVSYEDAHLHARFDDGSEAITEPRVDEEVCLGKFIRDLWLEPQPRVNPGVIAAIASADILIFGPGSLYTSILPNVLVPDIREAVADSRARILFVMNLLAEGADMQQADSAVVTASWERWLGIGRPASAYLFNSLQPEFTWMSEFQYKREHKWPIRQAPARTGRFVYAPLWKDHALARHDVPSLARALSLIIPCIV